MRYIDFLIFLALLLPTILSAQPITWQSLASRIPGGLDERRLRHLEQNYTVEEVEPNVLKMTHTETGMVKYVDITDHQIDFGRLSSAVQVIDLINADTTLYNWKYVRKNMFPIGSLDGYPMSVGDFNNNGKLDLAGSYLPGQSTDLADCAVAELQVDSTFTIQKVYLDTVEIALQSTDADLDGLLELNFKWGAQYFANYEQTHPDSFPDSLMFLHRMWEFGGQVASETFTNLDKDIYTDVLYVGTDSTQQCCHQVFVAEYDTSTGDFQRRFGVIPSPDWRVSGFSVGDFDNDGLSEIVTGSVSGDVYVFENTGNDAYQQVFYDTLSTPNAYMTNTTNDIDGNGKGEFFVGGSSFYNGTPASRIYWFEAAGNNTYHKAKSFFLLGTDVLGFTELFIHDVNGDGIDDLMFSFSFLVAMITWNSASQEFDLYYLDQWENYDQEINSINMVDVLHNGNPNLFINIVDVVTAPRIRTYQYYLNPIVGIRHNENPVIDNFNLDQNYPNPFNGSTMIHFHLPTRNRVSLAIYDITGKEVIKLISNRNYTPGDHEIAWNGINQTGKEVSSGLYFYVLQAGEGREVRKMLLIK